MAVKWVYPFWSPDQVMNLKKVWWQIIGNLGRDSRLRRNPDLEGQEQDIRVRTSSWSYFCLLWKGQVQLWLLLLIVLQQLQGDKPGTGPFLLLTPVLDEPSFSAPFASGSRACLTASSETVSLILYWSLYYTDVGQEERSFCRCWLGSG